MADGVELKHEKLGAGETAEELLAAYAIE